MSTFVLIHGGYHGAWCWYKVIPLLQKLGHKALAPDLPGHGEDKTPIAKVTMQAYVVRVCKLLDEQCEPVVLVGHSMSGAVITQVAEERPDKINRLVYISAVMVRNGESVVDATLNDAESAAMPNFIMSPDGSYTTFRESALKETFYHDCSEEDVAFAKSKLGPQATAPLRVPIKTSDANFGRIPRLYIECLNDRALTPEFQKQLYRAVPCEVVTIDSSHSPFLSRAEELVKILSEL